MPALGEPIGRAPASEGSPVIVVTIDAFPLLGMYHQEDRALPDPYHPDGAHNKSYCPYYAHCKSHYILRMSQVAPAMSYVAYHTCHGAQLETLWAVETCPRLSC